MSPLLRLSAFFGMTLVVGFIGAALFGPDGVRRHEQLGQELRDVKARNAQLDADNRRLAAEVKALGSDERYVEHVIRDELGWVAADDVVLIFPETPAAP